MSRSRRAAARGIACAALLVLLAGVSFLAFTAVALPPHPRSGAVRSVTDAAARRGQLGRSAAAAPSGVPERSSAAGRSVSAAPVARPRMAQPDPAPSQVLLGLLGAVAAVLVLGALAAMARVLAAERSFRPMG